MIARSLRLLSILVLVAVLALPARTTNAQHPQQLEQTYRELLRSVVRIETRYVSIFAPPGAGSGVVIAGDGLIATADHVIANASEVWVVHPGEDRQRAEIVKRAPAQDLALIRIKRAQSLVPIAWKDGPARPAQCVLALGNVMNWGIGIFHGVVSWSPCADGCPDDTDSRILTDITTPPGLSGGALVDCASRSLVGIISFGVLALNSAAPTAGIVGAVPVLQLEELMARQLACGPAARAQC